MSKIVWDKAGERQVEAGIKHCVFYPFNTATKKYDMGYAWNGITSISEDPDGADAQELWADNIKYAVLRGAENHKGSIKAYTYPDEFMECDGTKAIIAGVYVGQQTRKSFGVSYITSVGSDTETDLPREKLHLVYGMTVSPSSREYQTINDNPDAIEFSWDYETIPQEFGDASMKPSAIITIDSSLFAEGSAAMTAYKSLLDKLYGTADTEPELPSASDVIAMFQGKSVTAA